MLILAKPVENRIVNLLKARRLVTLGSLPQYGNSPLGNLFMEYGKRHGYFMHRS